METVCTTGSFSVAVGAVVFAALSVGGGGGGKGLRRRALWAAMCTATVFVWLPVAVEFAPVAWLAPLFELNFTPDLYEDIKNKKYLEIRSMDHVTSWDEAMKVADTLGEPVIFHNLLEREAAGTMAQSIVDRLVSNGTMLPALSYDFSRPYDFLRGQPISEVARDMAVADVVLQSSPHYISFAPFAQEDELMAITRGQADLVAGTQVDTNFISNFNRTVASAAVHAAPAGFSWSVQLSGTKTWFLWEPEVILSESRGFFIPTLFPVGGSERSLFSHPTYKVVVGPGDVLVFPPLWAHVVNTSGGLNVMLNLRTKNSRAVPIRVSVAHTARLLAWNVARRLFSSGWIVDNPHSYVGHGLKGLLADRWKQGLIRDGPALRTAPVEDFL